MNIKSRNTLSNPEDETTIQTIAKRMSEQISQVVAGSLREILFVIREDRRDGNYQPATDQNQILTAGDVAEILKISKSQAYHMIRRREIPSFSIGRTVRVRRVDLDAVVEAHMSN